MEAKVPQAPTSARRLSRFNVILVVILIVQLILTVALLLPNGSSIEQSQGPLLKAFNPDSVTAVTIHDKNNASQLALTKDASGNWVLPSADNYPVSNTQMTTLLGKIKALDTNRLIAQNASSQNRLEVSSDTYEKLIEVTSGSTTVKIYLGSSEGTNATHTRLDGEDQIYLTSGLATSDASNDLTTWISTPYYSVTQEDVAKFTIVNKQGTFEFDKGPNAIWTWTALGKNDTLNSTQITNTLGQASSVTLQEPLGKTEKDEYGMKAPLATITMVTETSVSVSPTPSSNIALPFGTQAPTPVTSTTQTVQATSSLVIGAKQADGNYVAKASNSDWYVEISSGVAEAFTNLKPSDLITPPATAAATTAATQSAAAAGAAAAAEATTAATSAATPVVVTPTATLPEPATVAAQPAPISTLPSGTAAAQP